MEVPRATIQNRAPHHFPLSLTKTYRVAVEVVEAYDEVKSQSVSASDYYIPTNSDHHHCHHHNRPVVVVLSLLCWVGIIYLLLQCWLFTNTIYIGWCFVVFFLLFFLREKKMMN